MAVARGNDDSGRGGRDPEARHNAREIGKRQSGIHVEFHRDVEATNEAIGQALGRHDLLRDDPVSVQVDAVVPESGRFFDAVLVTRGELLVWDNDVPSVLGALAAASINAAVEDMVTPRVRRLRLPVAANDPRGRGDELARAARVIHDAHLRVSANHVLPFSQWWFKSAASPEPSPVVISPRPASSVRGAGVTVAVIDTGIDDSAAARADQWLADVTGDVDPGSLDGSTAIGPAGGHGTFVSGIIRQVAPGCTVRVYRALDADGIGGEVQVAQAIIRAAADGADVINLSLGSPALFGDPPLAVEDALESIPRRILVVAAAGNDGNFTREYPAAFKRVISVGALEHDLTPAPYSNRGPWVDVSTIGTGAVSTFVTGRESDGDVYSGDSPLAVWSGTSFAAPQVAGLAAVMLADGIDPLAVSTAIIAAGRPLENFGSAIHILDC
jgi:subtilisin family serine protease